MASKLPTVAIIGQANVGKSSLFNRMVRAQQAIVAREPGTTRDNVLGRVEYDYHQFWLVDTAGLKDPNDEFEASIQEQITEAADAADVILVVVDSSQYASDQDRFVAKNPLSSSPTKQTSKRVFQTPSLDASASKPSSVPAPSTRAASPMFSKRSLNIFPQKAKKNQTKSYASP